LTRFLEALADSLRGTADSNRLVETRPVAVLWPDERRQWEPVVPLLREELPLLALGPFDPASGTGSAHWLRCMIARTLPEPPLPGGTPVIYLPGHSARQLSGTSDCPSDLEVLTELHYRGQTWARPDGQDWTPPMFFKDKDAGLGIGLVEDGAAWGALCAALPRVVQLSVDELHENAPWKVRDFQALMLPNSAGQVVRLEDVIAGHETERVEFKSTAFFDVRAQTPNKAMTGVVIDEIASFLNADGGLMIIGVDDNGKVLGLDSDWQTMAEGDRTPDEYQQRIRARVREDLGPVAGSLVSFGFPKIDDCEVCVVSIVASGRPVFRKVDSRTEEFIVRQGNGKLKLKMSEAVAYIQSHWNSASQ
jgi:hypothetical protein